MRLIAINRLIALFQMYLKRDTFMTTFLDTLKWPFISLILYYLLQVQFKKKTIIIRFEVHYKCTFNTMKHTSFSQVLTDRVTETSVTFILGCELRVVTRLCNVSKPSLMLNRLFCSAEMCVIRRVSVCKTRQYEKHNTH